MKDKYMNKLNLKNILVGLTVFSSFLVFTGCKDTIEPSPANCRNFENGNKYNAGVARAATANKNSFDRGVEAGKLYFTNVNGIKDGKAKIYKETYDKVYKTSYDASYQEPFNTAYADANKEAEKAGIKDGTANGDADGKSKGAADGISRADADAKAAAIKNAKPIGEKNGSTEGKYYGDKDGQIAGSKQGAVDGYDDGYKDGYRDAGNKCAATGSTNSNPNGKVDNSRLIAECEGVGYAVGIDLDGSYKRGYNSPDAVDRTDYNNGVNAGYADASTVAEATQAGKKDGSNKGADDGRRAGYNKKYLEFYNPAYKVAYDKIFGTSSANAYNLSYTTSYTSYFNSYYKSYYDSAYKSSYNQNYKASYYDGYYGKDNWGNYTIPYYGYNTFYKEYFKSGYRDGYAAYKCARSGRIGAVDTNSLNVDLNSVKRSSDNRPDSNVNGKVIFSSDFLSKSKSVRVNLEGNSRFTVPDYPQASFLGNQFEQNQNTQTGTQLILAGRRSVANVLKNAILNIQLAQSVDADKSTTGHEAAQRNVPNDFNNFGSSPETESLRKAIELPYKFYWEN